MTKPRRSNVGRIVGIAVALTVVLLFVQPWNTPETRAYRICGACGMDEAETRALIATIREAGLTREQSMELWRDTDEPLAIQECSRCAEAIADAACDESR